MARIHAIDGMPLPAAAGPWELAVTEADAYRDPRQLAAHADWIAARVPGTAAGALRDAGRWSDAEPTPLHSRDVWYRAPLPGNGRERLCFEGLATLAEVWIDGAMVLATRSMFQRHSVDVELTPESGIAVRFRSLSRELAEPHRRGRWRPRLATPGSLRHVRTSLLGFMPGWCPPVDCVGPYRPITRQPLRDGHPSLPAVDLRATLDRQTGRLAVRLRFDAPANGPASLACENRTSVLRESRPGCFDGVLELEGVEPWWPHTHGEPRLYSVRAAAGGRCFDLGRVGFRAVTSTRPFEEGLSLAINDVPVFCRGANWMPADLVELSSDARSCRPLLQLARDAGMNMLRVPGIGIYEAAAFHDLCDEMGIMVWQDLMLANFDYPHDDPTFRDSLAREIEQFLDRMETSPSLCVVGGGSEVCQQAAMLGLARTVWSQGFGADTLPSLVRERRPDVLAVPNSPSGGDLPFAVNAGVAHYYGVGAYLRPLDDARRAEVGFASECLAFANVPEPASLAQADLRDPRSERWSAGVPRDRGADWTFEDVRDHYQALLFGTDPAALRRDDPERYLALGRATVAEVMEATFAEWRRSRSPTAGGLVWLLRDLAPGAGWGVVDSRGRPKSAWYALKRAFRPRQVSFSDEGLNGLHVHVHNESAAVLAGVLHLGITDADGRAVAQAEREISIAPRESRTWTAADLLGRFFDATHAYRFGPATHSLCHASLDDSAGERIAESFFFPLGRSCEPRAIGLWARLTAGDEHWTLEVGAERHACCVHVDTDDAATLPDNHFHLGPRSQRRLLVPGKIPDRVVVGALNAIETVRLGFDGN